FNVRGYANTTMEQIAKQAGASTKTIYSRYPNKVAILKAAAGHLAERALGGHFANIQAADPREIEPQTLIASFGKEIATTISGGDGRSLVYLALSEARHHPEIADLYKATTGRGIGYLRAALEAWKAKGLLPDLQDAAGAARLCLSMLTDAARI